MAISYKRKSKVIGELPSCSWHPNSHKIIAFEQDLIIKATCMPSLQMKLMGYTDSFTKAWIYAHSKTHPLFDLLESKNLPKPHNKISPCVTRSSTIHLKEQKQSGTFDNFAHVTWEELQYTSLKITNQPQLFAFKDFVQMPPSLESLPSSHKTLAMSPSQIWSGMTKHSVLHTLPMILLSLSSRR